MQKATPKVHTDNTIKAVPVETIRNIFRPTLFIRINDTAPTMQLDKFLKSWTKIIFNSEEVSAIPSNTSGLIEVYDAVAHDVYGNTNNFNTAIPSAVSIFGTLDTSNMTDMSKMFAYCKYLEEIKLKLTDTSKLTKMVGAFMSIVSSTLNTVQISGLNTSNVTDMSYLFSNSRVKTAVDFSSFDTSNVVNMGQMFINFTVPSLDISNFNTSKVTNFTAMFDACSATELNIDNFDMSKATNVYGMFGASLAETISMINIDLTHLTLEDTANMFSNNRLLTRIDATGENVNKHTLSCLGNAIASSVPMPGMYRPDVTIMVSSPDKYEGLAYKYVKYDYAKALILNLSSSFNGSDLSKILSSWGTIKFNGEVVSTIPTYTEGVAEIFDAVGLVQYSLTSNFSYIRGLVGISGYMDTSATTSMGYMFRSCSNLVNIDITQFNTDNVANVDVMFGYSKITSIDLSKFNFSKVTNVSGLFEYNDVLTTVNLSNIDIASDANLEQIFSFNKVLETIYIKGSNVTLDNVRKISQSAQSGYDSIIKTVYVSSEDKCSGLSFSKIKYTVEP